MNFGFFAFWGVAEAFALPHLSSAVGWSWNGGAFGIFFTLGEKSRGVNDCGNEFQFLLKDLKGNGNLFPGEKNKKSSLSLSRLEKSFCCCLLFLLFWCRLVGRKSDAMGVRSGLIYLGEDFYVSSISLAFHAPASPLQWAWRRSSRSKKRRYEYSESLNYRYYIRRATPSQWLGEVNPRRRQFLDGSWKERSQKESFVISH